MKFMWRVFGWIHARLPSVKKREAARIKSLSDPDGIEWWVSVIDEDTGNVFAWNPFTRIFSREITSFRCSGELAAREVEIAKKAYNRPCRGFLKNTRV